MHLAVIIILHLLCRIFISLMVFYIYQSLEKISVTHKESE